MLGKSDCRLCYDFRRKNANTGEFLGFRFYNVIGYLYLMISDVYFECTRRNNKMILTLSLRR